MSDPRRPWRAAYRLQLRPGFGFAEAQDILDYLQDLGVSHVYCSPVLEAGPGSEHGYDVISHDRIRAALGGEEGLRALASAAHERGMGLLVDIVPNHMAIGGSGGGNRWWWDVLEHGQASPYATVFDIDWAAAPDGRVLVPVLGGHYRQVVEAGELSVRRTHGRGFEATYYEHRLPLRPGSLPTVLRGASARAADPVLAILAEALEAANDPDTPDGRARLDGTLEALSQHLADRPAAADAIDLELEEISGDRARLDALLRDQHWRLANWRLANPEIAYRRFFDVTELVALRTDRPEVFEATHRLVLDLVADGTIDGLRVDHPDGLRDPEGYLSDLAGRAPDLPVWVEKILGPGEELPHSWPVAGATGYEFLDAVSRLYLDDEGVSVLADRFAAVAGVSRGFDDEARRGKREVLATLLAADLERVVELAARCCRDAGWDISRIELRAVLVELVTAVPVYRTYVRPGRATDARDTKLLDDALAEVFRRRPAADRDTAEALVGMLRRPGDDTEAELVIRFQQLCASTAAKGIEDTALYRWSPVAARCEVGCEPDEPGLDSAGFSDEVRRAAVRWSGRLLDTSTHDTKRSEDVRARLLTISEVPDAWWEAAEHVRRLAAERSTAPGDPGLEHLLLQSAAGAWPLDAERIAAYAVKAAREAKTLTSWLEPDGATEERLETWARALVADPELRGAMEELVEPYVLPGRITGLSQVVLKLTCPGVPVLYQGTELWDHSLVDPDNRRPVDYRRRRELLSAQDPDLSGAAADLESGALKLRVIARVLDLRRRRPGDLAPDAGFVPLGVRGSAEEHAVAFLRGEAVAVVAPRLARTLLDRGGWGDTVVDLSGTWRDVLTGRPWSGETPLAKLLDPVPVAVLERDA